MPNPFETAMPRGVFGGPGAGYGAFGLGLGQSEGQVQRDDEQHVLSKRNDATGRLIEKVGPLLQRGLPPNKIITTLMNDPEFVEAFTRAGNADEVHKMVLDIAQSAQAPKPKPTVIGPGQTHGTTDPNSGIFTPQGTTETTELQTFKGLNTLGKFSDEETKILVAGQLAPKGSGERTAAERAVARRVARGDITSEEGDMLLSPQRYRLIQPKNDLGQPTGQPYWVDLVTGDARNTGTTDPNAAPAGQGDPSAVAPSPSVTAPVAPGRQAPPGQVVDPATQPMPVGDTQRRTSPNPTVGGLEDPTDMFVYTGPFGMGRAGLETIGGAIDPSLTSGKARAGRNALRQLRLNVHGLREGGRRLSVDTSLLDGIMPSLGVMENPTEALGTASQLIDALGIMKKQAQTVRGNSSYALETRKQAEKFEYDIDQVINSMPTKDQIEKRKALVEAGKGGAVTPGGLVNEGLDMATKAAGRGKPVKPSKAVRDYSRMTEEELLQLNVGNLSPKDREAVRRRALELKNQR